MPVRWNIDHQGRRVEAIAEGVLTVVEVRDYFDCIAVEGAMPYAKLFDMMAATHLALSVDELKSLGASMRQYAIDGHGPIGPVAIVVPDSAIQLQAAHYADATVSNRSLQIFRERTKAETWLSDVANGRPARRR